jgi:2-polyprenyl-6-methoxyphenol hydroxylase-like FAD-dependent oxidoreductase
MPQDATRHGVRGTLRAGSTDFDVVVVGGSLAGCTTATLYGRRGLRVAVLERRPDMDAYKVVCAHYIQAGTTPMLRRHGFAEMIEAAGAIRNHAHLWTRYGWIRGEPEDYGYTLRRQVLDPLVRRTAAETPGVELLLGYTAQGLTWSDGRVSGVEAVTRDGHRHTLRAPLVVAADGRESRVARMANVPGRVLPHNRFTYSAYVRGLPRPYDEAARGWFLDPDAALVEPCDDDLTLVVAVPHKTRLPEFKRDVEGAWLDYIEALPDAPPIRDAERVSNFIGKVNMPNVQRPGARNGVAFVGDAAVTSDPIWAVGCGWAFQASEWLVGATAGLLGGGRDPAPGLARYRRRLAFELTGHHLIGSKYSSGRPFSMIEKLLFAAGARDPMFANHLHGFITRMDRPHEFLTPRTLGRAVRVVATSPRDVPQQVVERAAGEIEISMSEVSRHRENLQNAQ